MEFLNDRRRRALGQEEGVPETGFKILKALLMRACEIREDRGAIPGQDRDGLQKLAFDLRERSPSGQARVVDPTNNHILHLSPGVAIGNMRGVDPGRRVEQSAGEMARG